MEREREKFKPRDNKVTIFKSLCIQCNLYSADSTFLTEYTNRDREIEAAKHEIARKLEYFELLTILKSLQWPFSKSLICMSGSIRNIEKEPSLSSRSATLQMGRDCLKPRNLLH